MDRSGSNRALAEVAVVVNPARDDVAVAREAIAAGTTLASDPFGAIVLKTDVAMGHRFAVRAVPAGKWVHQYGQPFARSLGLSSGDPITPQTVANEVPHVDAESIELSTPLLPPWEGERPTFMGFRRSDGRVGVRNWVLIVPTSMCSSHESNMISMMAEMNGTYTREKYPNVDGVTAIPHTRGCGCPDGASVDITFKILADYLDHPNV